MMIRLLKSTGLAALLVLSGGLATAQGKFLTAAEVKPILNATKANWIAIREFDGKDLLYFTQLLSWRCGLEAVHYGINSDVANLALPLVPCDEEAARPGALPDNQPIYAEFGLKAIYFVTIKLIYDDGTTDQMMFKRKAVQTN